MILAQMMQVIRSVVEKIRINQIKERPSMIQMKNYLHPFFGFGSIYGTGSYILSATEEWQWNLDVRYVTSLPHAEESLR